MTKNKLFMMLAMGSVAATLACDNGSGVSTDGLSTNDCPIGMFRPVGLDACVFSADDVNGNLLALTDDRCAVGTPAIPPTCVSDAGLRSYLATSETCAPSYRYEPGACERGNNLGSAGVFTTGFGTAGAGAAGAAGEDGFGAGPAGFNGGSAGAVSGFAGAVGGFAGAVGGDSAGTSGNSAGAGGDSAGAAGTNLGVAGGND